MQAYGIGEAQVLLLPSVPPRPRQRIFQDLWVIGGWRHLIGGTNVNDLWSSGR